MIRSAQVMLVLAASALWIASRLTWVEVRSFDGLGQPRTAVLSGATWSTALIPLALLLLAAAVGALAVRGWILRLLAILVAVTSAAMAYLAISLWVVADVAVRGADLTQIPLASLVGSQRHYWGAVVTLVAALCALVAAVLLMRSAAIAASGAGKYAAPAARRAAAQHDKPPNAMSDRMIWDALDEGRDPTKPDTEGR